MRKTLVCIGMVLFLTACATPSQRGPVVFTEALPESEGEQLYLDMKCAACHGYQGTGDGFFADGLLSKPVDFSSAEVMEPISDDLLEAAIREGKGSGMPKYADFTDSQAQALVRYIRTLSHSP